MPIRRSISPDSVRQNGGLLFGARREKREQRLEIVALPQRALRAVGARDLGRVEVLLFEEERSELVVEVVGGVGERGEEKNLLVPGIDG